jgi:methyl-galactoside transport system permease protein
MEQVMEQPKAAPQEEKVSLIAERAMVATDRREIRGRIEDLRFDNLSPEEFEQAKAKIYKDHEDLEKTYRGHVQEVEKRIQELNGEMAKIAQQYKEKIQTIQEKEQNPSKEEIDQATVVYHENLDKENASFLAANDKIKEEIVALKKEGKEKDAQLRLAYKKVQSTPMKRAEKESQLEALKQEIYKNLGSNGLLISEKQAEAKKLQADHKAKVAKFDNDLHLETNRVQTMTKNLVKQEKAELLPLKEEKAELNANYRPVAPFFTKIGLGISDRAVKFARKQRDSFTSWKGFGDWFIHNAVYLIILVMVIYTASVKPAWFNFDSFVAIMKHTSALLPLALGVAGTIVLTGTDLSLGRIWGLTALLSGILMGYASSTGVVAGWTAGMPWIWILVVLLLVMAAGGLGGALNGFFVAKFSIHPFVVTLATQLIIYGVILLMGDSLHLSVIYNPGDAAIANSYYDFVSGGFHIGNTLIEWYNVYALLMLFVMWFIWNKTKFGKAMFAVGCNPDAANVSGINVNKTIIWTFILAGIMYGVGGFEYNPINGGAQLSTGTGGELDPITAAVIGGVSFTGGIGKVSGVLVGCILLKVIDSCLLAIGASTAYINLAKGAIILFAVALDMKKYIVKK